MMGKYAFGFAGSEVYLPANANDNDDTKCSSSLKGLASVSAVTCKRESFNVDTGTGVYLITLKSYPEKPYMNNLIHHNGNPGINLFSCNASKIDNEEAQQPYCFVSNAEPLDGFPRKLAHRSCGRLLLMVALFWWCCCNITCYLVEQPIIPFCSTASINVMRLFSLFAAVYCKLPYTVYAECGNHGVCDRVSGVCACERGFKGDVCLDMQDNEVHPLLLYCFCSLEQQWLLRSECYCTGLHARIVKCQLCGWSSPTLSACTFAVVCHCVSPFR